MSPKTRLLCLLLVSTLSACATLPPPSSSPSPPAAPQELTGTPAVAGLVTRADRALDAGEYNRAAEYVERALRIEPRNAALWQRLARVRLVQGNHGQAVQLASKSNTLAGRDEALRRDNWLIIAEAHELAGNAAGALAAREQAAR